MPHRHVTELAEQLSALNHYFDPALRALFPKLQDLLPPNDLGLQLMKDARYCRQTPYLKMLQGDILRHLIHRRPQAWRIHPEIH